MIERGMKSSPTSRGKKALSITLVLLFVVSGMVGTLLLMSSSSQGPLPSIRSVHATGPTVPSGILHYVPVSLTNSQTSVVLGGTQVMVLVNWESSVISSWEGANLQNVRWFNSAGTVLNAWLENGTSSSTKSAVWVKLDSSGISASSSIVIYLGFDSTSTNDLSTSGPWGAYPTYTGTYAQYDDGSSVFVYYQNFAGSTCPSGWTCSSNSLISNGLTVSTYSNYAYTASTYGDNSSQMLDIYGDLPSVNANNVFSCIGYITGTSDPCSVSGSLNTEVWALNSGTSTSDAFGYLSKSGTGTDKITTTAAFGTHIYQIYWASSSFISFGYDYKAPTACTGGGSCSYVGYSKLPLGAGGSTNNNYAQTLGPITWMRIRVNPPSGAMPSEAFDEVPVALNVAPYTIPAQMYVDGTPTAMPAIVNWVPGSGHTIKAVSPTPCSTSPLVALGCSIYFNKWNGTSNAITTTISITTPVSSSSYTANYLVNGSLTRNHEFGNLWNATTYSDIELTSASQQMDLRFTSLYSGTLSSIGAQTPELVASPPTYWVALESDAGGLPSGHVLTAGSFVPSTSCSGACTGGFYPLTLNVTNYQLVKNTVYDLVYKYDTGTIGGSNYAEWKFSHATSGQNPYLQGYSDIMDPNQAILTTSGSGWSVDSGVIPVYEIGINGQTFSQGTSINLMIYRGAYSEHFFNVFGNYNVSTIAGLADSQSTSTGILDFRIYSCASSSNLNQCVTPNLQLNKTVFTAATINFSGARYWNESLGSTFSIQNATWYVMGFFYQNGTATNHEWEEEDTNALHIGSPLDWDGYLGGMNNAPSPGDTSPSYSYSYEDMAFAMHIVSPQQPEQVIQQITLTDNEAGPIDTAFVVTGCSPFPATIYGNGFAQNVVVSQGCSWSMTGTSASGVRYGFITAGSFSLSSASHTSCTGSIGTVCSDVSMSYDYQLQLSVTGGNGIVFSPTSETSDGWFLYGDSGVTVTSNCAFGRSGGSGTRVASWQIDGGSSTSGCTSSVSGTITTSAVTMTVAHSATFNQVTQYQITFVNSPVGGGTSSVTTNPTITGDTGWYDAATMVTPSATANGGYTFTSWTGTGTGSYTGSSNPATNGITMDAVVQEMALFTGSATTTATTATTASSGGGGGSGGSGGSSNYCTLNPNDIDCRITSTTTIVTTVAPNAKKVSPTNPTSSIYGGIFFYAILGFVVLLVVLAIAYSEWEKK